MSDNPPQFLTVRQVAELLQHSRAYVRRLCERGRLRAVRFAARGEWRIDPTSLYRGGQASAPRINAARRARGEREARAAREAMRAATTKGKRT